MIYDFQNANTVYLLISYRFQARRIIFFTRKSILFLFIIGLRLPPVTLPPRNEKSVKGYCLMVFPNLKENNVTMEMIF